MLKSNNTRKSRPTPLKSPFSVTLIAAKYNLRYVDGLLNAAKAELQSSGRAQIEILRVPGSFEIPTVASVVASRESKRPDAILCLGVIWRGETAHADHIGTAITQALLEISVRQKIPVIHQVLLLENEAQARARCLDVRTNRGVEAARTAIEMIRLLRALR